MQKKIVRIDTRPVSVKPIEITEVIKTQVITSASNIDLEGLKSSSRVISNAYEEFKVDEYIDEERLDFTPKGAVLFGTLNIEIYKYMDQIGKNKKNIQMEDWRSFPWKEHLPKGVKPGSVCNRAVFMLWCYTQCSK